MNQCHRRPQRYRSRLHTPTTQIGRDEHIAIIQMEQMRQSHHLYKQHCMRFLPRQQYQNAILCGYLDKFVVGDGAAGEDFSTNGSNSNSTPSTSLFTLYHLYCDNVSYLSCSLCICSICFQFVDCVLSYSVGGWLRWCVWEFLLFPQ